MRDTDVAPKRVAFREARNVYDAVSAARRDHALAAAGYFKIAGRNFEVELELVVQEQCVNDWNRDYGYRLL